MTAAMLVEMVGYLGSVLVVVSMLMTSLRKFAHAKNCQCAWGLRFYHICVAYPVISDRIY